VADLALVGSDVFGGFVLCLGEATGQYQHEGYRQAFLNEFHDFSFTSRSRPCPMPDVGAIQPFSYGHSASPHH
jgi:hypothetical protein